MSARGVCRFKFWVFGAWREVVVDDRLPTRAGRALYSRGALPGDFTLPLLEKAYAKWVLRCGDARTRRTQVQRVRSCCRLYGSYAALRAGSTARALQDLSGGVVQSVALRGAAALRVLHSAVARCTLLLGVPRRAPLPRQPYAVTGLARVRGGACAGADAGTCALVRVRAVSGRGAWAGAWAPHSAEWRALPDHDRQLLQDRASAPGDFWSVAHTRHCPFNNAFNNCTHHDNANISHTQHTNVYAPNLYG